MNNRRRDSSTNFEDLALAASASANRFFEEDEEDECDFTDRDDDGDNDDYYGDHHQTPINLFSDVMHRGEHLPLLGESSLDFEKIGLLPPLSDENSRSNNLISTPTAASDSAENSHNSLLDAPVSTMEEGDFRSFKMQFLFCGTSSFLFFFTRPFCR